MRNAVLTAEPCVLTAPTQVGSWPSGGGGSITGPADAEGRRFQYELSRVLADLRLRRDHPPSPLPGGGLLPFAKARRPLSLLSCTRGGLALRAHPGKRELPPYFQALAVRPG